MGSRDVPENPFWWIVRMEREDGIFMEMKSLHKIGYLFFGGVA
jgi:hypothetical protein